VLNCLASNFLVVVRDILSDWSFNKSLFLTSNPALFLFVHECFSGFAVLHVSR
jgi:hypothetical protein